MLNERSTYLFEKMPVPKAAGKLMLPTIIGSLVMVIYSLADTLFVGLLGDPIEAAAVALASPVLLAFNAVNNLFGTGSSSMMSRALGRGDFDTVRRGSAFGFYCALGCGLLFSLICMIFKQPLMTMLGVDDTTRAATEGYMLWTVLIGAAPSIINVVFAYLVRAEGESLHASIGTMSGCVLNMLLDPIFIMPWGLGMGAAGAGLATMISNTAACLYFIILIIRKRGSTNVSINPRHFSFRRDIVSEVFGVGVPAAIQNLLNVVSMTLRNNLTAGYGADAIAAMGIAQKIYMVPFQISWGGTQGIMPLIGYTYSSGNHKRMKQSIAFIAKMMLPLMTLLAVVCWIFSRQLMGVFISDAGVINYGEGFLRAMCLSMPCVVADFMVVGVMQAVGRGRTTLIFAILRKIVFEIPAIVILEKLFQTTGIAYSAFAAESMVALIGIITLIKFMRNMEKQNSIAA